jgi:hypothetical protein
VRGKHPDFVFLSAFHPRETLSDAAWRSGMDALAGHAEIVYVRAQDAGRPAAVLMRTPSAAQARYHAPKWFPRG